jgi:FtsZ-binding cell division protein ZapB
VLRRDLRDRGDRGAAEGSLSVPRVPTLPEGALRIFARVDRFHCECPCCGELLRAAFGTASIGQIRRAEAKHHRHHTRKSSTLKAAVAMYNPLTQRLKCPRCYRTWGVGLLLYPVAERLQPQQPYDTKPTWAQLLALRQTSTIAFMVDKPLSGSTSVNILVEGACTCEGRRFGRADPRCPIHGTEELLPPAPALEPLALAAEIERLKTENAQLVRQQERDRAAHAREVLKVRRRQIADQLQAEARAAAEAAKRAGDS